MRRTPLLILFIVGCDPIPLPDSQPASVAAPQVPRWSGPTGGVAGQVRWSGPRPAAVMIETYRPVPGGRAGRSSRPAPNIPKIDPAGGIAGVLVYLDGVSSAARNGTTRLVGLELNDALPMVRQGDDPPRSIGLVHRGDAIAIVNKQDRFHAIRARGRAFWTFTLPDADRPLTKRLDQNGIVELSSAAGYYWMHAYLFVCEHPYCALTDAAGNFELPAVPPGDYRLVAWLPSWDVVRRERDPESTAVARIQFGPHHEWRRPVAVRANETTSVAVTVPTP